MPTKTGLRGGTILTLAAVVLAVAYLGTAVKNKEPKHELHLSLEYIHLAGPTKPVRVEVTDGNTGKVIAKERHVPEHWNRTIRVAPGTLVLFKTFKPEGSIFSMGCMIFDDNGNVHDAKDLQGGQDILTCKASVL